MLPLVYEVTSDGGPRTCVLGKREKDAPVLIRYSILVSAYCRVKVFVEGQAATGLGSLFTSFLTMNMGHGIVLHLDRTSCGSSMESNVKLLLDVSEI